MVGGSLGGPRERDKEGEAGEGGGAVLTNSGQEESPRVDTGQVGRGRTGGGLGADVGLPNSTLCQSRSLHRRNLSVPSITREDYLRPSQSSPALRGCRKVGAHEGFIRRRRLLLSRGLCPRPPPCLHSPKSLLCSPSQAGPRPSLPPGAGGGPAWNLDSAPLFPARGPSSFSIPTRTHYQERVGQTPQHGEVSDKA